jgi:glycosyltransferase involved in cell wall biosynthesis
LYKTDYSDKDSDKDADNRTIRIVWQGYPEHLPRLRWPFPILEDLERKLPGGLQFFIDTNLASGLPIVTTPTSADRCVLEHGETGFIAENEEQWRTALHTLAFDPTIRERIGRAARASVAEPFSPQALAREHLRLFDRVMTPSAT